MVTKRLASSVTREQRPATQTRTAVVKELLSPSLAEDDTVTGWQVLLDFGGGEVRSAGCSASYAPVPGDTVVVSRYQNTLFIVDRLTAGDTGDMPGGRVAFSYYDAQVNGNYATAAAGAEVAVPGLTVPVLLRNGAAYDVEVFTGYNVAVANTWVFFVLKQNSTAGATLAEYYRQPATQAAVVFPLAMTRPIRNDTGVDIDTVLLLSMVAPPGGGCNAYGNAQNKPFIEVRLKGSSKLYPHAAPLPVPPDFTG